MFKIIACINENLVLGKDGKLIYTIGNDLSNFRRITSYNGVVIMGRKTFETIHEPLQGRINIIITSNKEFSVSDKFDNVYIANSIDDAIELCDAFFSDKREVLQLLNVIL